MLITECISAFARKCTRQMPAADMSYFLVQGEWANAVMVLLKELFLEFMGERT